MLGFLQTLLPRLRQFSQSLDQTELFVDKPWVLLDEDGKQQTYIFRRGGELLMSLDGVVQMGSWEYIAPAESILIDRKVDKLLLNHFFFTDAWLVLARDGRPDSKFVLANRLLIPGLDVESYLRAYDAQHNDAQHTLQPKTQADPLPPVPLHQTALVTTDNLTIELIGLNEQVTVGDAVYVSGEVPSDGKYIVANSDNYGKKGIEIKDGLVNRIFWPRDFKLTTDERVVVECSQYGLAPAIGDNIYSSLRSFLPDGKHTIAGFGKVRVRGGIIAALPWL